MMRRITNYHGEKLETFHKRFWNKNTKLLPLIFAQARCANNKGAQIFMGIRYVWMFIFIHIV